MNINDVCPPEQSEIVRSLLQPELVKIEQGPFSKKKLFENIAALFATKLGQDQESIDDYEDQILDALLARERLGSTALDKGVALPHGRVDGLTEPQVCLVKISGEAIDYDQEHDNGVWLVITLIVPTEEDEMHLKVYAALAACLQNEQFYKALYTADNIQAICELFK